MTNETPVIEIKNLVRRYGRLDAVTGLNLTVRPARQRTGIGRALLANLTAWSRQRGDASLFLEVRASNLGARALYAAAGFEEVGLRCDYYPAAGLRREDAVVMRLSLAS